MTDLDLAPSMIGTTSMFTSSLNKLSSQEGLKSCPFCGGEAEFENLVFEALVRCKECYGTLTRAHEAKTDTGNATVKAAWNTRHPSFNDAIEAAAKIVDEPLNGIEINRFIADGKVMTDRYGRELFITKENVEHILAAISSAIRSLKLPDYRGGDSEKTAESEHSPSTLNTGTE